MRIRMAAALLLLTLVSAGCTPKSAPPEKGPVGQTTEPAPYTPPAPPVDPPRAETGADLFPQKDLQASFYLRDSGTREPTALAEELIREGDRVVAVQNGKPYAAWEIADTGVWRLDTGGSGALLQYLPAKLKPGTAWKHTAGGAEVWFHLAETDCGRGYPSCWSLDVLNRDTRTLFVFGPGVGPVTVRSENDRNPGESFTKEYSSAQEGRLTPSERAAFLKQMPAPTTVPNLRVPVAVADFEAALARMTGVSVTRLDVDGDGTPEVVRGLLEAWTTAPVEVVADGGAQVAQLAPGTARKVTPVRFPGIPGVLFLTQRRQPDGPETVTIIQVRREKERWVAWETRGWDIKTTGTAATRVSLSADGVIRVEWEMGDPARHTRIREYRLQSENGQAHVTRQSERFVPQGKGLAYPTEPLQVLQAAFVARWFGLEDELPRYFVSPEAAKAMPTASEPNYGPGEVKFASVSPKEGMCGMDVSPAALKEDGTAPFLAIWGGYEWMSAVWGTVTFGMDGQGQTAIRAITVAGNCGAGE